VSAVLLQPSVSASQLPAVPPQPTAVPTKLSVTAPPPPAILRPFEPPRHRWDPGHRGVDLVGYAGEQVLAAGSGVVLYAGFLVDRPLVVVGHGALRTTYEPVAPDPSIAVGSLVTRGQPIGSLLPGHCSLGACLHWGLVAGHGHSAVYYDPLLLLGCGGVRLEPADAPPPAPEPADAPRPAPTPATAIATIEIVDRDLRPASSDLRPQPPPTTTAGRQSPTPTSTTAVPVRRGPRTG
jgi:murein DD-endopeptidase MepM/ murein hydrolase activator NlpD